MAFTQLTADVENISKLDNYPPDDVGMTSAKLKSLFDKGSADIKAYINGTLIPEINGGYIKSFTRTSGDGSAGTDDTYTITYQDDSTDTFIVHNGANGEKGDTGETGAKGDKGDKGADGIGIGDMLKSVYDPNSNNKDAFALANMAGDSTHRTVTDTEKTTWSGKQNALTFDSTPTASSTNPVTSGGVKAASDLALGRSTAVTAADTNYTSYMARGEALASTDTTPSYNGQICWKYG